MSRGQTGAKNGMWKGGKTTTQHGYVLIRVGQNHHLSDVRGYAYEHRVVAERKIGRKLRPKEHVHHINGDKKDNRPENLCVFASLAHHFVEHRKVGLNRRLPGQPNQQVDCACGCGKTFKKFDKSGRPRKFVSGHNPRHSPTMEAILGFLDGRVVARTRDIIKQVKISKPAVASALRKLKRSGLIEQPKWGFWRLSDV